ncbi:MAG: hypothetical protein IJR66_03180 [Clostridia bacterium]|nr:hypothetical protein [Clostridia bacterium]
MINFILKHFFVKEKVKKEERWHCELSLIKAEREKEINNIKTAKKTTPLNKYFNGIVSLKNKGRVNFH